MPLHPLLRINQFSIFEYQFQVVVSENGFGAEFNARFGFAFQGDHFFNGHIHF